MSDPREIIVRMGKKVSEGTHRAYKYRFYPSPAQTTFLGRSFGAKRWVWNKSLGIRTAAYAFDGTRLSGEDLMKFLPLWKKDPDTVWLGEISSVVLQQTLRDQDRAFKNFFDSCTGTRNGPRMRYPRFKTRNSRKSLRYTKVGFTYGNGEIRLAKMLDEPLGIVWSRPLPEGVTPSSVTVSQDAAGRWFISILCEEIVTPLTETGKIVGVDLGVKTFAVLSDGEHVEHPKLLATKAARLARYQRVAARRKPQPGQAASQNYVKAKIRVARQHVKVADARRDFLHTTTTDLVTRFDVVVVEDLHVAGMKRNRHLAKSVSDSGWGEFRTLIEYKTQWYGKRLIVIDRWHSSSKLCSTPNCGGKNNHLKLSDRTWVCNNCGTLHDRDLNAAKNIRAAGLAVVQRELDKACGEDIRPKASPRVTPSNGRQTSVKQETTPNAHAHARASAA
jgi:putative transposase